MFCEPVKPVAPSTTTILRWLRRSGRFHLSPMPPTFNIQCHSIPACVHAGEHLLAPGVGHGAEMVEQHADLDTALDRVLHGHKDGLGGLVHGEDEVLDMHIALGRVDRLRRCS